MLLHDWTVQQLKEAQKGRRECEIKGTVQLGFMPLFEPEPCSSPGKMGTYDPGV